MPSRSPRISSSGAFAPGGVDHQIVEGHAVERGAGFRGDGGEHLAQHVEPLWRGEDRRLAGMHPDPDHQPVGEARSRARDLDMAVGGRIERAG